MIGILRGAGQFCAHNRPNNSLAFLSPTAMSNLIPPVVEPLPEPLDDPMRVLRKFADRILFVQMLLIPICCAGICGSFVVQREGGPSFFWSMIIALVFGILYTFAIRTFLPARDVDLVYLRSFRRDRDTSDIRFEIYRALGTGWRIAGIRDPRRRWLKFIRFTYFFLFALHYASPRYLNLEAGDDWKKRLWRTLTLARGVVIDVTDLTTHVMTEVRMCASCLPLERILFVVDDSRPFQEWDHAIRRVLPPTNSPFPPKYAIWPTRSTDRGHFQQSVREFAGALPNTLAGSKLPVMNLDLVLGQLEPSPKEAGIWIELLIGVVLAFVVSGMTSFLSRQTSIIHSSAPGFLLGIVSISYLLVLAYHIAAYLWDCVNMVERMKATAVFAVMYLVPALLLIGLGQVKGAANRALASNNLKQLGLAFDMHANLHGQLPGADRSFVAWNGVVPRERVSWRVQLLPVLLETASNNAERQQIETVLRGYRVTEAWDSPHNLQFVPMMPKIYRLPDGYGDPRPGQTHLRVFVTPYDTTGPHSLFVAGQPGWVLDAVPDGTSNTILIAESTESVPWTCPDELSFQPNGPLPKLGRIFGPFFFAALADGSVHKVRYSRPDSEIWELISADGGVPVSVD
jgi:hypothetical protein